MSGVGLPRGRGHTVRAKSILIFSVLKLSPFDYSQEVFGGMSSPDAPRPPQPRGLCYSQIADFYRPTNHVSIMQPTKGRSSLIQHRVELALSLIFILGANTSVIGRI